MRMDTVWLQVCPPGGWLCRFPDVWCPTLTAAIAYPGKGAPGRQQLCQSLPGRHFRVSVSRCVAPDHYVSSFPAGILFVPHVSRLSGNDEQSRHTFHGNQEFNFSGCFLARFCTFHNRRIFPHWFALKDKAWCVIHYSVRGSISCCQVIHQVVSLICL